MIKMNRRQLVMGLLTGAGTVWTGMRRFAVFREAAVKMPALSIA